MLFIYMQLSCGLMPIMRAKQEYSTSVSFNLNVIDKHVCIFRCGLLSKNIIILFQLAMKLPADTEEDKSL